MERRSLLANGLTFIFSLSAYVAYAYSISKWDTSTAFILALIYIFPSFVTMAEDFQNSHVTNRKVLNLFVVCFAIGILCLITLWLLFTFEAKLGIENIPPVVTRIGRIWFSISPLAFLPQKAYPVALGICQIINRSRKKI